MGDEVLLDFQVKTDCDHCGRKEVVTDISNFLQGIDPGTAKWCTNCGMLIPNGKKLVPAKKKNSYHA